MHPRKRSRSTLSIVRDGGVLALLCLLAAHQLGGERRAGAEVLRATRIELVDAKDRTRILLGLQRDKPYVALLGADGGNRVELSLEGQHERGELRFLNERGDVLLECGVSRGMGLVVRADSEETPGRVLIDLGTQGRKGSGAALLIGEDGLIRVAAGVAGADPTMLQGRSSGTSLSTDAGAGAPVLQLYDATGRTVFNAPPK